MLTNFVSYHRKLHTPPSFSALAFHNALEDRTRKPS